jgi:hypothetical protein
LTALVVPGHNRFVVRGVFLALLFCLAAWTGLAHMAPESSDRVTTVAAASGDACSQPGESQTGDSSRQWHAQHHANTPQQSLWKTPLVRVHLAGARGGDALVEVSRRASPPLPATWHVPAHLLTSPLLI